MGATPFYLAIILARANAYSCTSTMLRLSGTVVLDCCGDLPRHFGESILCVHVHCCELDWNTWYIIGEMHAVIALIVTCVHKSSNL